MERLIVTSMLSFKSPVKTNLMGTPKDQNATTSTVGLYSLTTTYASVLPETLIGMLCLRLVF